MAAKRETTEPVELFESETILERGHRTLLWLVRRNDEWTSATEWPGAVVESLAPGPGTVWERRIEIRLPRGTVLQRVESRPAPVRRRDPLDYLAREARRAARRVKRSRFRVGRDGDLVPERPRGSPPHKR